MTHRGRAEEVFGPIRLLLASRAVERPPGDVDGTHLPLTRTKSLVNQLRR